MTLNSFYFVRQHSDNYALAASPNYKAKAATSRGHSAELQSFPNDLCFRIFLSEDVTVGSLHFVSIRKLPRHAG